MGRSFSSEAACEVRYSLLPLSTRQPQAPRPPSSYSSLGARFNMALEPFLGTRAQKAFFFTVILQAIVVLTMVGITFGMVAGEDVLDKSVKYKTLPCYLSLFALAEIFEVLMVIDALRLRNIIQLFGVTCKFIPPARLLYSINRRFHDSFPLSFDAPVVIGVSLLAIGWYLKELYSEFGWAIFHVVGANPKMKTMYQYYQIMICLLKFDFFFFTGVTMQLLILVLKSSSAEFGITVAAIPIVLVLLVLCGLAVQREIRWIMSISLVMMLASLSYFYKLVRFYQPQNAELYSTTRASLTIFTIVAFLLLFTSFGIGLRCFFDFDKGLAPSKTHSVPTRPPLQSKESTGFKADSTAGVPLGPRISIE
ncbi:hypothetical protein NMY22_g10688 [Coprinellus aureogranulatus]|nr:hypothetical protein NMY22_g10688 [Coprinellus aureogranulatus]